MKTLVMIATAVLMCCSFPVFSDTQKTCLIKEGQVQVTSSDMERFIGHDYKGNFAVTGQSVIQAFESFMADTRAPMIRLNNGDLLFQGCRLHECDSKAAVVTTSDGYIKAAALFHLYWKPVKAVSHRKECNLHSKDQHFRVCNMERQVTLFIPADQASHTAISGLKQWAQGIESNVNYEIVKVPKG